MAKFTANAALRKKLKAYHNLWEIIRMQLKSIQDTMFY